MFPIPKKITPKLVISSFVKYSQAKAVYFLYRRPIPETTRAIPEANKTESNPLSRYSNKKYIANKTTDTNQALFKYFIQLFIWS